MQPEKKFIQMVRAHEGIIFKISTVYTRSVEDQKDLYQEIVYQLWKAFGMYKAAAKVSTWIYRISLNTAITRLRKAQRKADLTPIDQAILQYTESTDPVFEEQLKLLYRAIENLNTLDKGIVLLYLEDHNYEEIAQIIGLSVSNVGTRLSRIRQKMRTMINKQE